MQFGQDVAGSVWSRAELRDGSEAVIQCASQAEHRKRPIVNSSLDLKKEATYLRKSGSPNWKVHIWGL